MTRLRVLALRACVQWSDIPAPGVLALIAPGGPTAQVAAYAINIVNTSRNAKTHDFDEISWYFPTFLNDELIAVPLGVLLWCAGLRLLKYAEPSGA